MRQKVRAPAPARNPIEKPHRRTIDVRADWLVAAFLLIVLAYVATDGDWNFFPAAGTMEEFYDGQAQSLLHGRIDVPLESIFAERFVRNGKFYGYFGPTPALPRIPLNLLFPGMYGRWSRFSMLLGSLAGMALMILLFRRVEQILGVSGRLWALLRATLLVSVFLGSTNVFISTESRVYQEAIMWASALTLAQAVFLVSYLRDGKMKWLALSCIAAFLAFNAKISSGAGALFALLLLDAALLIPSAAFREYWGVPQLASRRRAVILLTVTLLLSAGSWAGLNYWKYGLVFTSQPLQLTPNPDPARLKRIKGDPFSLANIPLTLSIYLGPSKVVFGSTFPWVFQLPPDPRIADGFPAAHFDSIESVASVPASMPILLVCALSGMVLCFAGRRASLRIFRAPMCGVLAGSFLILGWGYISYRFLHDAMPWFALGSTIAVAHIPLLPGKRTRWVLTATLLAGSAYGVWVNLAFSAVHKRNDIIDPGTDPKRVAFADFSLAVTAHGIGGAIDYLRHWRQYIPAADLQRGNVTAGNTIYTVRPDVSLIWYDGPPPGVAEYTVDFPAAGVYQVAFLYASPDPRPLHLLVNGVQVVPAICAAPTGGPYLHNDRWSQAGLFRIAAGPQTLTLASDGKFPIVRMMPVDPFILKRAGPSGVFVLGVIWQGQNRLRKCRVVIAILDPSIALDNKIAHPASRRRRLLRELQRHLISRIHDHVAVVDVL